MSQEKRSVNPYPGLRPFGAYEAPYFFGRQGQIDALLDLLSRNRVVVVTGRSGCGKSSLVRAGLLPDLLGGLLAPGNQVWRVIDMRPGARPIEALAAAFVKGEDSFSPEFGSERAAVHQLAARFRADEWALSTAIRDAALPEGTSVFLLVDQFEELFRRRVLANRDEGDQFVRLLLSLASPSADTPEVPDVKRNGSPDLEERTDGASRFKEKQDVDSSERRSDRLDSLPPIYVIVTIRSEYVGHGELFDGLPELLNRVTFHVPRLTREQCREVIEKPARMCGVTVETSLVNRLLNEFEGARLQSAKGENSDSLPLLQHALMYMWNQASTKVLRRGDYRWKSLGEALNEHADDVVAEIKRTFAREHGYPVERTSAVCEAIFKRISELGGERPDSRAPATLGEIAAIAREDWQRVAEIVEQFRQPDRSFLSPFIPNPLTEATCIDVSHECLIRKWITLERWAREEERAATKFRELLMRATSWEEKRGDLLGTNDLEDFQSWKVATAPTAEWASRYAGEEAWALVENYLGESDRLQRKMRKRLVQSAAAVAVVVALATSWIYAEAVRRSMLLAAVSALYGGGDSAARHEKAREAFVIGDNVVLKVKDALSDSSPSLLPEYALRKVLLDTPPWKVVDIPKETCADDPDHSTQDNLDKETRLSEDGNWLLRRKKDGSYCRVDIDKGRPSGIVSNQRYLSATEILEAWPSGDGRAMLVLRQQKSPSDQSLEFLQVDRPDEGISIRVAKDRRIASVALDKTASLALVVESSTTEDESRIRLVRPAEGKDVCSFSERPAIQRASFAGKTQVGETQVGFLRPNGKLVFRKLKEPSGSGECSFSKEKDLIAEARAIWVAPSSSGRYFFGYVPDRKAIRIWDSNTALAVGEVTGFAGEPPEARRTALRDEEAQSYRLRWMRGDGRLLEVDLSDVPWGGTMKAMGSEVLAFPRLSQTDAKVVIGPTHVLAGLGTPNVIRRSHSRKQEEDCVTDSKKGSASPFTGSSGDGRYAATIEQDGSAAVWDLEKCDDPVRVGFTLADHAEGTDPWKKTRTVMAISDDGKVLITLENQNRVAVGKLDLERKKVILNSFKAGDVGASLFAPRALGAPQTAIIVADGAIYETTDGGTKKEMRLKDSKDAPCSDSGWRVHAVAFANPSIMAVAFECGALRIYRNEQDKWKGVDAQYPKELRPWPRIERMAFGRDGEYLVAMHDGGAIAILRRDGDAGPHRLLVFYPSGASFVGSPAMVEHGDSPELLLPIRSSEETKSTPRVLKTRCGDACADLKTLPKHADERSKAIQAIPR